MNCYSYAQIMELRRVRKRKISLPTLTFVDSCQKPLERTKEGNGGGVVIMFRRKDELATSIRISMETGSHCNMTQLVLVDFDLLADHPCFHLAFHAFIYRDRVMCMANLCRYLKQFGKFGDIVF